MDFFFVESVYHYGGLAEGSEGYLFSGQYLECLDDGHKNGFPQLQRGLNQGGWSIKLSFWITSSTCRKHLMG